MTKIQILTLAATLACGLLGCTTTRTTTTVDPVTGATNVVTIKVPDKAKTEKVVSLAETVGSIAFRRALEQFPKEADTIALYASAVGSIFCDMQATRKFSPENLEAGIAALALPHIKDDAARLYVQDARDILRLAYRQFYADRFNAELPPDEWAISVATIFCNSLDQALKDSGRPGIKPVVVESTFGPTTKEALRKVLGQ